MGSSPTRGTFCGSFFLGKVTALGVLCCFALFVCLTLLASFFLPSHLSFKNMYIHCTSMHVYTCTCTCMHHQIVLFAACVCVSDAAAHSLRPSVSSPGLHSCSVASPEPSQNLTVTYCYVHSPINCECVLP